MGYDYGEEGEGGVDRRWFVCGVVVFGLIVVLLILLGVGIFRLYSLGIIGSTDPEPTEQNPILFALTQTALAQEAADALQDSMATQEPPTSPPLVSTSTPADQEPTLTTTEEPTQMVIPTQGPPIFTASQATFCRRGPSTIYAERTSLNAGEEAPIRGKATSPVDEVSVWWLVETKGVECFVSGSLGTTAGDLTSVPVVSAPPTPSPTPTPTNTPSPTPSPTP